MTIREILAGESKNVEFKEDLPERSIRYMKSVVAFANGIGGKIIFGVRDETGEVIGIDREDVFKDMDAIANAISDSCEPAIIPDITLQTVDGKTVIVVEIAAGRQRPYYIKSQGKDEGVYIRVAGTTRQADEAMIKELMFEGSNRSFDQIICRDLSITDEDIDLLCKNMKAQAMKNAGTDEQKAAVQDVGRQQLRSWGVLVEQDGKDYPSNAYAILTGGTVPPLAVQCGVFKGSTKEIFVDRKEYTGPIWEQIDEAFQFVLRNIRMGATIVGIYRKDVYEIPPGAIRELIINAAVHRSYLDRGNIQVAIYDDRLEVTSPGKLPMGQTLERMKEGYSHIRNEALARAFAYMNLIEHWGSGIPRILGQVRDAGLAAPEFVGGEVDLRISIYRNPAVGTASYKRGTYNTENTEKMPTRCHEGSGINSENAEKTHSDFKNVPESAEKVPKKCRNNAEIMPKTDQEQQIYRFVQDNGSIKTVQAAQLLCVKERRARVILAKMADNRWLSKEGATKNTKYVINERKEQ